MGVDAAASDRTGQADQVGRLVPCPDHGPSLWCFVQRDGSHLDQEACLCLSYPSQACPVDAHRLQAQPLDAMDQLAYVEG